MNIENKVYFLGRVENVFPYLKRSDCFVFSSLHEGFGNVLTEALSQDLPVISTDCTAGPREILCPELGVNEEIEYPYFGEYGILTKPFKRNLIFESIEKETLTEQEEMFADMMVKINEDSALKGKYDKGHQRVMDFDTEIIIQEWEKL